MTSPNPTPESGTDKLNPVIFCGAGPGDPDLITVKGQQALAAADLVVYAGSLVPEALLKWTRPDCRHLSSAGLHLDEIVATMADAWSAGQSVVRLHTGDPSLYGAIFEQMAKLSQRQIPYTVIPGVTAAFAAAAALGVEWNPRQVSLHLAHFDLFAFGFDNEQCAGGQIVGLAVDSAFRRNAIRCLQHAFVASGPGISRLDGLGVYGAFR